MIRIIVYHKAPFALSLALSFAACSVGCSASQSNKSKDDSSSESTTSTDDTEGNGEASNPGFTPSDNDQMSEPAEVAGAFLTSLSCVITNQADSEAKDTAVSCKLQDKRGDKFGGSVKDVSASIVLAASTKDVPGIVTILSPDASDTFVVIFPGVSPQGAIGIEVLATLDGEKVILQSPLLNGSATASISDKDLYVSASADPLSAACTKEAPCKSLRRALLFVPDIIGHKITVQVSEGVYQESIKISGKTFRDGGSLTVKGVSASGDGTPAVAHLAGNRGELFAADREAAAVTLTRNTGTEIAVANLGIEACMRYGVLISGSTSSLSNIHIVACQKTPEEPEVYRPPNFAGLSVVYGSEVIIKNGFTIEPLQFPLYVPTGPDATCAADVGPASSTCLRFQTAGITIVRSSSLELESGDIELLEPMDVGIKLTESSLFSVRSTSPKKIHISKALSGISVFSGSIFQDSNYWTYPTQEKRLSIAIDETNWGIWTDHGSFEALFADIVIGYCSTTCLRALNEGRTTIGRDAFSEAQPRSIVSKLALNTVPVAPNTAEGSIAFAGYGTRVSILPTVEDLTICHTGGATKPVFEAGLDSQILLRANKDYLTAMINRPCASNLGIPTLNLGTVKVSVSSNSQTFCDGGMSLNTCIDTEIAKNP